MAQKLSINQIVSLAVIDVPSILKPQVAKFVKRKVKALNITDNQVLTLDYIQRKGHITYFEALGEDWRILGGLFTRGLVEWIDVNGVRCVRRVQGKKLISVRR